MTAKTLSSLVGGGLPAIQAVEIKNKSNALMVTQVVNSAVDATGAGVTYTVTGRCLLIFLSVTNMTTNDTIYTLTCDGGIKEQSTSVVAGTTITPINSGLSVTSSFNPASSNIGGAILCETGFSFFVKTTADTSITVSFNYLELN